jgi:uncharacterized protein YkwD
VKLRKLFLAASLAAALFIPAPAQNAGPEENLSPAESAGHTGGSSRAENAGRTESAGQAAAEEASPPALVPSPPPGGEGTGASSGETAAPLPFPPDRADPDADNWDIAALDTGREAEYLTPLEKDVLLETNKVRSDPKKYAELYIKPMTAYFKGTLYMAPGETLRQTYEGLRSVNECIRVLSASKGAGLLQPERGLSQAARDHVLDTGPAGIVGHTGRKGSTLTQRINRHGRWDTYCGENISYGCFTGREILLQLLIDDGVSSRGHRTNIMNRRFTKAGVAAGPHKRYGYMCVIDYAAVYVSKPPKETVAPEDKAAAAAAANTADTTNTAAE